MAHGLLGPPQKLPSPASSSSKPEYPVSFDDAFLDSMAAGFNKCPPRGCTEDNSATYLSSGNPCRDFFYQVVPDTPASTLVALLEAAWEKDDLTALKLICHLRGAKSDKEGFYTAALWLHAHHPKTLALNLRWFAEFGYFKDLLEVLYRLLNGADVRKDAKAERRWSRFASYPVVARRRVRDGESESEKSAVTHIMSTAPKPREERKREAARKAAQRYDGDPEYRYLHDKVSELFAQLLSSDLEQLGSGNVKSIGLAAKWCPSLDSSFDRATLICESIARRMFPRDSDQEYRDLSESEEHYVCRARGRLRKEALAPLRKVLELPELYMSSRRWDSLPYGRVPSVAMKAYKGLFKKHDKERFSQYLEKVKLAQAKISGGPLLPHEILADMYAKDDDAVELQWKRMVKDISDKGTLKNCIAMCDVSGSMTGTALEVSVALGLLISELSEEPWRGNVITFRARPQLLKVRGETLRQKMNSIQTLEWGPYADFQEVFDRLLDVALTRRLKPERMVKRVFVFSDMEFHTASTDSWENDYEAIRSKFLARGYGSAIPDVVFWNLRESRSTPETAKQEGIATVRGFSKNLVKLFLDDQLTTHDAVMHAAVAGEEYEKLLVFD